MLSIQPTRTESALQTPENTVPIFMEGDTCLHAEREPCIMFYSKKRVWFQWCERLCAGKLQEDQLCAQLCFSPVFTPHSGGLGFLPAARKKLKYYTCYQLTQSLFSFWLKTRTLLLLKNRPTVRFFEVLCDSGQLIRSVFGLLLRLAELPGVQMCCSPTSTHSLCFPTED